MEGLTIIQISQDGGHNQRDALAVCASSRLKIDSKGLTYCAISFVTQEYDLDHAYHRHCCSSSRK